MRFVNEGLVMGYKLAPGTTLKPLLGCGFSAPTRARPLAFKTYPQGGTVELDRVETGGVLRVFANCFHSEGAERTLETAQLFVEDFEGMFG